MLAGAARPGPRPFRFRTACCCFALTVQGTVAMTSHLRKAGIVDNLRAFQSQHKMKKAALHIIAGQLSEEKIKVLRQTFEALDANGDGLLTSQELKDGMAKANLEHVLAGLDLDALMEGIDADGSGLIDYTEFLAATLDKKCYLQEDVCYTAFSVFDQDGDGHITLEAFKPVLVRGMFMVPP
eukprot:s72_g10.t1